MNERREERRDKVETCHDHRGRLFLHLSWPAGMHPVLYNSNVCLDVS